MNTSLEARDASVIIGTKTLLNRVSIQVKAGQVMALLGANGAGKSTLLRILAGELTPNTGQACLDEQNLKSYSNLELAKRRAVLPQESYLEFPFSVLEVALMGRSPHVRGNESTTDYDITRQALEQCGVLDLENRAYPTLSGGERQRVQLARVLAQIWQDRQQTRFLLLDEPTSSLDLQHQHDILRIAREFAAQGVGVIAILHDLNLASVYADQIVIMQNGIILAAGTPKLMLEPNLIYEAFKLEVAVLPHPTRDCPLIVPLPN